MFWKDINPPPEGTRSGSYLTAITEMEGDYVLIIDVEKILSEVSGAPQRTSQENIDKQLEQKGHVLVVDDSVVARSQIQKCIR